VRIWESHRLSTLCRNLEPGITQSRLKAYIIRELDAQKMSFTNVQRQSANVNADGYGDGHDLSRGRTSPWRWSPTRRRLLVHIDIWRKSYSPSRQLGPSRRPCPKRSASLVDLSALVRPGRCEYSSMTKEVVPSTCHDTGTLFR
jgi:hypothetical protein